MTKGKERERDEWIQALKPENPSQTKWTSRNSDRICLLNVENGIPTKANSLPTIYMGFDTKGQKTQRLLFKHPLPAK